MASMETLAMFRMPSRQSCRSFKAECPTVLGVCGRRPNEFRDSFEQRSCYVRQGEKVAIHGLSSSSTKRGSVQQSPGDELQRNVVVRGGPEKASDHFDSTNFFLDELIEAKSTMGKLAEPGDATDFSSPWQEEGTSQLKEDEETNSNGDVCQDSKSSGLRKLPIESNGPPMVVLQAYLKADTSQQQEKEKLRHLPLPMPHKARPVGLPRPSLRRRLGIAYSRKKVPVPQESDSSADS